jgi:hypothetical protein
MDIATALVTIAMLIVLLLAFNGKGWIETYWKGKTECKREERQTAEANARAAEAKLELARINAGS